MDVLDTASRASRRKSSESLRKISFRILNNLARLMTVGVVLNDRENILSALRGKPLKVREVMKRANAWGSARAGEWSPRSKINTCRSGHAPMGRSRGDLASRREAASPWQGQAGHSPVSPLRHRRSTHRRDGPQTISEASRFHPMAPSGINADGSRNFANHPMSHRPGWISNFTKPSSRILNRKAWQASSFTNDCRAAARVVVAQHPRRAKCASSRGFSFVINFAVLAVQAFAGARLCRFVAVSRYE
jgi:hypothetical protein